MITNEEEVILLRKRLEDLERALLDLTPGGSEFHGSPQHCLDWIKDQVLFTVKLAAQRNRYRKVGDELAVATSQLLRELEDANRSYSNENNVQDTLNQWNEVRKEG